MVLLILNMCDEHETGHCGCHQSFRCRLLLAPTRTQRKVDDGRTADCRHGPTSDLMFLELTSAEKLVVRVSSKTAVSHSLDSRMITSGMELHPLFTGMDVALE